MVWEPRGVLSGPELTYSEGQDASAQAVSSLSLHVFALQAPRWPQVSSSGTAHGITLIKGCGFTEMLPVPAVQTDPPRALR